MTNEEYQQTQHQVMLLCQFIKELPLGDFLHAIERAEVCGPILDPTLYRKASGTMGEIKLHAEALWEAQRFLARYCSGWKPVKPEEKTT